MRFSILIPVYKISFLKECLDSVLNQDYYDFEVVLLNDQSPFDVLSLINSYSDKRIRYYENKENIGAVNVVDNWNKLLKLAEGDFIICMGDDDMLMSNCLSVYSSIIDNNPNIGLIHGWTKIIDENSQITELTVHRPLKESAVSLMWHRWHCYNQQFIGDFCYDRKWLNKNNGFFKLPLAWGSDDISAIIGACKNGVINTQIPVFLYRKNHENITSVGNVNIKLQAIDAEMKWCSEFLSKEFTDENDQLYQQQLLLDYNKHFDKKKGLIVGADIKSSCILKCFYWFIYRKKYNLSRNSFLYGLLKGLF